jgi:hypothetical protein
VGSGTETGFTEERSRFDEGGLAPLVVFVLRLCKPPAGWGAAPIIATVRDWRRCDPRSVKLNPTRADFLWNGTVPLWLCDHETILSLI